MYVKYFYIILFMLIIVASCYQPPLTKSVCDRDLGGAIATTISAPISEQERHNMIIIFIYGYQKCIERARCEQKLYGCHSE